MDSSFSKFMECRILHERISNTFLEKCDLKCIYLLPSTLIDSLYVIFICNIKIHFRDYVILEATFPGLFTYTEHYLRLTSLWI